MRPEPEAAPRFLALLGFAGLYALAVAAVAAGVVVGIADGSMVARPAYAGLGAFGLAGMLAALLSGTPPERVEPRLHGTLAIGLVICLLTAGFLYGPVSLFVAAGVPLAAVATVSRLGRRWGFGVLLFGVGLNLVLTGLALAGVVPTAPAFHASAMRGPPVVLWLQSAALLVAGALALTLVPPPAEARVARDPSTPRPAPAVRSGTFTASDLELLRVADAPDGDAAQADATFELQKLESLGVLAGGIAHDFNNLLMSVLGNTSLALMEVGEEHPVHGPLREVEVAARRARDLVGQLLAYAGKGTIAVTPIDLNALVREMGDLLSTAIGKRATLDYQLCPSVPLVVADATQLRQIVMNLITNGADAMSENPGTIALQTEIRHVGREELDHTLLGAAVEPGVYVLLRVSDQGVGMDPETLSRIFDPFFTTKSTGRGLGLAAVLGIVRRYGGTMEVISARGRGTTFRVLLPYAAAVDEDEDMPTEHTSTARGWNPSAPGAVLVVDDDPVVLRVTSRMVSRLKFDVLEAPDGPSAIAHLERAERPVLAVVLDMTMPGMDGPQTFHALRAIDPTVRVILTSGYSEAEVPRVGDCVFLQKPYSLKQLTQAIDRVLDGPARRPPAG